MKTLTKLQIQELCSLDVQTALTRLGRVISPESNSMWKILYVEGGTYDVQRLELQNCEFRIQKVEDRSTVSVRWINGDFWYVLENLKEEEFHLTEESIQDILEWSNLDLEKVSENIFYAFSDSGHRYEVDIKGQTCKCKGYQYKYSHVPKNQEGHFCKHMTKIFLTYPDWLPTNIVTEDSQSQTSDKNRFPRDLFDSYITTIRLAVEQFPHLIDKMEVCGSYRRGVAMVSDLDILVTLKDGVESWSPFLDYVEQYLNFIPIKQIGRGEKKAAYMIDGFVHIDFKVVPPESWTFALLHFTGSKLTNINMRRAANSKGCTLNEYGLTYDHDGSLVPGITDEKSVFDFLELPYLKPWMR